MKKLLTYILVLLLLCGAFVLPLEARAEETAPTSGECGNNGQVKWSFDGTTGILSITGKGAITSYDENFNPWKSYRGDITAIAIGDGVTEIGDYAFALCENLTEVTIPQGLTRVGKNAFQDCKSLKAVKLPESVATIGTYAFKGCESMESINIPGEVTIIEIATFEGCKSLKEIALSDKITKIGNGAFRNCESLTEVELPENEKFTEVGGYTFAGCKGLETVIIPEGITLIGNGAFQGCESLNGVTLPFSLVTILPNAFDGCISLSEIVIPAAVTAVEDNAFKGCTALRDITFAEAPEAPKLGANIFQGVTATVHYFDANRTWEKGGKLQQYGGSITWHAEVEHEHKWGDPVVENKRDASCTTEGSYETVIYCLVCKDEKPDSRKKEVIYAQGHQAGEPVRENEVKTGCTTDGHWDEVQYCTVCKVELSRAEKTEAAHGHEKGEPIQKITLEATCITDGEYEQIINCKHCGIQMEYEVIVIPAMKHKETRTEEENRIEPDCVTRGGYDTATYCVLCGIELDRVHTVLEPLGHEVLEIGTPENRVEPTCTTDGSYDEVFYCVRMLNGQQCGAEVERKTIIIPKLGHTEGEMVEENRKEATCTADGSYDNVYYCTVCLQESRRITVTLYAPGHVLGEAVEENRKEATCTLDGSYEKVYYCTTCKEAVERIPVTLPAPGHAYVQGYCTVCKEKDPNWHEHTPGQPVIENELHPDCVNDGQYDTVVYCTECMEVISRKTTYLPIGEHNYVKGKCTGCGRTDPEWEDADGILEVTRTLGQDRFFTAFNIANQMKENLGVDKFDNIIIASGVSFADALSGSYLASVKNAPILLSYNDAYNTLVSVYVKNNLKAGGTVYILGGEKAVPKGMEDKLKGFEVKRLAGADRFETNLAILKEAGIGDKDLLVCTGLDFADSLSASACERPILLVWNQLNGAQTAFLKENVKNNKIYVVGGTSAVNLKIQLELANYGRIKRINGNNRFETSVMIAEEFFSSPNRVVMAYAGNYPDGLCGGALAASRHAPLILTMNGYESYAADYVQSNAVAKGSVLGGSKLISDKTVRTIFGMPGNMEIPTT